MAKTKKRKKPIRGSIYAPANCDRLYIKYAGKRIASGMPDTDENYEFLRSVLDEAFLKEKYEGSTALIDRLSRGKLSEGPTIQQAWDIFKSEYSESKRDRTNVYYASAFEKVFEEYKDHPLSTENITEAVSNFLKNSQTKARKNIPARPLSPASKDIHLRAIITFTTFLNKRKPQLLKELPDYEFLKTSSVLVVPEKEIKIYQPSEIDKMLKVAENSERHFFIGLALDFAVNTGFRKHEILELAPSQLKGEYIEIFSKDFKRRDKFPITKRMQEIFKKLPKGEFVFPFGGDTHNANVQIWRLLNELMEISGVEKDDRSWHVGRKTFISRMALNKIDIRKAAKLARCGIDVMMNHYIAFGVEDLANELEGMTEYSDLDISLQEMEKELENLTKS